MKEVRMVGWKIKSDTVVELKYNDSTTVDVKKSDFDRAFGAMINAEKNAVIRDFSIATA